MYYVRMCININVYTYICICTYVSRKAVMAILTHKRHGKEALSFHYEKDGVIITPLMLMFEHMHGKLKID